MTDNPISAGNPGPDQESVPFFSARLTPHRSLGRVGVAILMMSVGVGSFLGGIALYRVGAWPVVGFVGLDMLLISLAFHFSFAQARAFEEIDVAVDLIRVRRVDARGNVQEYKFNPAWVRLDITRLADEGVTALRFVSHGRSLTVGAFLNPDDRGSFANALGSALNTARRGGPAVS